MLLSKAAMRTEISPRPLTLARRSEPRRGKPRMERNVLERQPQEPASANRGQFAWSRAVLVTGTALAGEAIAILEAHGLKTFYCEPYASAQDIARRASDLQIEGLIVRQGQVDEGVIAA